METYSNQKSCEVGFGETSYTYFGFGYFGVDVEVGFKELTEVGVSFLQDLISELFIYSVFKVLEGREGRQNKGDMQ